MRIRFLISVFRKIINRRGQLLKWSHTYEVTDKDTLVYATKKKYQRESTQHLWYDNSGINFGFIFKDKIW